MDLEQASARAWLPAGVAFAAALGVYVASSNTLPGWLRVSIGLTCALLIVAELKGAASVALSRGLAAALAVALVGSAAVGFDTLANHHFVLTLFGLSVVLNPNTAAARRDHARSASALLAALMLMAVVQKLASPVYLSGDYFAYLLSTGGLGGPISVAFEGWSDAVARNLDAMQAFVMADNTAVVVTLAAPFDHVGGFARALALAVVFVELWLASVFALAHRHRAAAWSLGVFALGLALMREEWVFGTTLCALGFSASDLPALRSERAMLAVLGLGFGVLAIAHGLTG